MLKEYNLFFKKLMLFSDLFIVVCAFFLGGTVEKEGVDFHQINTYIIVLPILVTIWAITLYYFGIYESFRTRKTLDVLFTMLETAVVVSSILGGFLFLAKLDYIGRMHIFYTLFFATAFLCFEKVALIFFFRYQRRRGFNTRNILVVGTDEMAKQYINAIDKHNEWGIKIVGLVDEDDKKINMKINEHKVIGSFEDVADIIRKNEVQEVLFVIPSSWMCRFKEIEEVMHRCEIEGLKIMVAMDLFKPKLSRTRYSFLDKFPILTFESTPNKLLHLFAKRIFDVLFSSCALIVLSSVLLIVCILVKATSKGGVFFRQQRCGLYGRKFAIYKFRTMVEDAEDKLSGLLAYNKMNGPVFKMENDPRVTKVGKLLRKFSIDEFPQLWNVLKGDMSLVGPRPPIPEEVDKYEPWQRRRLSMRPGLTCLWQACGRNNITDFNEWMKLDLEYIDNWSLYLDFKILLKTIPMVLFGIGAR